VAKITEYIGVDLKVPRGKLGIPRLRISGEQIVKALAEVDHG
jgi:hypothetical protein